MVEAKLHIMITNKNSSDMKKKIYDIVFAAQYEGLSTKEATDKLLVLFGVVGRSEQLFCPHCGGGHENFTRNGDHVWCQKCDYEFNVG